MRDWLAYSLDTTGYRQYTLHVKDLRTGALLERADRAHRDRSSGPPTTGRSSTPPRMPVSKRSDKFWRHIVGADGSDLVFEEKDELFDVGAGTVAGPAR